ncbi:MAG: DUF177 domain-containing protein [Oscillospiraceae bacterium]|nr:DUF177 domain-containing protein [Oscillospiraceae bacterium]
MIMQIKKVLNIPGTCEKFDFTVPDERLALVHSCEFASPVQVIGSIANHAGVVTLSLHISFSLLVTCDRCLKQTVQAFSYQPEHIVVRRLEHPEEDEENYIIAKAESIDLAEIALSDLLLELPTKMLCKEDCKGLCPVCGCDKNTTECDCMNQIVFI